MKTAILGILLVGSLLSGCEYYNQRPYVITADPNAIGSGSAKAKALGDDQKVKDPLVQNDPVILPSSPDPVTTAPAGTPVVPSTPATPSAPSSPTPSTPTPTTPTPSAPTPTTPSTPVVTYQLGTPAVAPLTPPELLIATPADGATNVDPDNPNISITLSLEADMSTLMIGGGGFSITCFNGAGVGDLPTSVKKIGTATYVFTPGVPLMPGEHCEARATTGIKGEDSEALKSGKIWSFTIGERMVLKIIPPSGPTLREYYRMDGSGGNGGAASEVGCPDGEAMVGLRLVEDTVIASVEFFACQPVNALSDASQMHWVTVNPVRQPGTIVKEYIAAAGEVLDGFSTQTIERSDSLVVGSFVPYFVKVASSGVDDSSRRQSEAFSGTGSNDAWSDLVCPKGYAETGLRIRAGGYVDRLGPVCRRIADSSEPKPAAASQMTIDPYEGYEFGFVEYDWTPKSIGLGENSQPVLGADGVKVMACSPGEVLKGIAIHANEIVDGVYGISCDFPDGTGSMSPEYLTAEAATASDPGIHIIEAAKGSYLTGWAHKRSENDGDGNQDEVMVSQIGFFQQAFGSDGRAIGSAVGTGTNYGLGTDWDGADDNYTDWINETCPVEKGFVLAGIKLKIENNRPRALGGICRRIIAAGQTSDLGASF